MRSTIDTGDLHHRLQTIVGAGRVSAQTGHLESYSRDMWPRLLLARAANAPLIHRPHVVVWPESVDEVAEIVAFANQEQIPIVPYGGGSGVCGGVVPVLGGITVDLKRMNQLLSIDQEHLSCDVQSGQNGERFERALNQRGYTFGHFPSSIYCSTVGGWIATRAAGQLSNKYGKVEDRVLGVTAVTGKGEIIITDDLGHTSAGPNWTQLLVGSEGTLGIITSSRLRLSPAPEQRFYRGYQVENCEHGIEAMRQVMQCGLRPAVVRLYDELDTFVHLFGKGDQAKHSPQTEHTGSTATTMGPAAQAPFVLPSSGELLELPVTEQTDPKGFDRVRSFLRKGIQPGSTTRLKQFLEQKAKQKAIQLGLSQPRLLNRITHSTMEQFSPHGCLLIIGLEGSRVRTEVEAKVTFNELERAGCRDLGEGPGLHWLKHRYDVSYKMSGVFREGAFVDTMEVASSWERLRDLHRVTKAAISQHALVMSHFSHAYPEGCSIYFTFVAENQDRRSAEATYDAIWRDGLSAVSRVGGTISHHHGVGLLKGAHMAREHRESMRLIRAVKATLDPEGIMNPGKLGIPIRRTTI